MDDSSWVEPLLRPCLQTPGRDFVFPTFLYHSRLKPVANFEARADPTCFSHQVRCSTDVATLRGTLTSRWS